MLELRGKYNTAKVFTDNVENSAISQIIELCNQEVFEEAKIRIMPDCLTDDTEVLTTRGFIKIINLNMDDKIANYNKDTGHITFSRPKKIIVRDKRQDEKIYRFYNNQNKINMTVSENHRMAIKGKMGVTAKNVGELRIKDLVLHGEGVDTDLNKYSDDLIRLIVWVVGDGSIKCTDNKTSINKRIRFGLKKERKINRIKELLDRNNYKYSVNISKKQTTIQINTEFSKSILNIVTSSKTYPSDFMLLNKRQSLILLEEAILVDGDYEAYVNGRGYRLNTAKRCEADLLASIISMNYGFSRVVERYVNGFNGITKIFYVSAVKSSSLLSSKSGTHNRKILREEIKYDGKLVCLECDTSFFLARQGGNSFITGNCHAGAGCVIGFTADLGDKVIPNIVGVDIGCGMLCVELGDLELDLESIDKFINNHIPSGFSQNQIEQDMSSGLRDEIIETSAELMIDDLRPRLSVGSLGGGNHFIEIANDENGNSYLIIHSGSRNFGYQIAKYYQDLATTYIKERVGEVKRLRDREIGLLKQRGREDLIQESVKIFDDELNSLRLPKALCYLEGELRDDYLRHMKVAQKFATESRIAMAKNIVNHIGLDFEKLNKFETVHNYINFDDNVVRKGAISANKDEMVLIPMNMRDGSLLCRGKGNEDWNNSAPHGAGRLMSRSQAKESLLYDDFKNSMSDIYSTSVLNSTLDEAPMAYKPMDEIVGNIQDTVEIISVLKPIYNFKAH